MARLLAVLLIAGGFVVFLQLYSQGADRAFGGAFARFWSDDGAQQVWEEEPAQRRRADLEERTPSRPIGQGVRERVTRAIDDGARRHSGED